MLGCFLFGKRKRSLLTLQQYFEEMCTTAFHDNLHQVIWPIEAPHRFGWVLQVDQHLPGVEPNDMKNQFDMTCHLW